MQFRIVVI